MSSGCVPPVIDIGVIRNSAVFLFGCFVQGACRKLKQEFVPKERWVSAGVEGEVWKRREFSLKCPRLLKQNFMFSTDDGLIVVRRRVGK
jgi:hypothetical protein